MKVGRKILSWDEYEIFKNQIAYLMQEEGLSKEDAQNRAQDDSDLFNWEFENLCEMLSDIIDKKNKGIYWKANVKGFGWMKRDGYKYFTAKDANEFLRAILPSCDCTYSIFNYGRGLAIRNSHHDAPCGEWYYILPVAESTYKINA